MNSRVTWADVARQGIGAREAAAVFGCSLRTAIRFLRAESDADRRRASQARAAASVARECVSANAVERSNWPEAFRAMADRIMREGQNAVPVSERERLLAGLPRGIVVQR